MSVPSRVILRGMFGKPTLQWLKNNGTESNGRAEWTREWRRYGQWTAKLSPGIQTNDDYGSVSWDVNGMRLADLQQISYVYRMGATEVVAPNVAIHVYDPNDIDNRADISLSHSTTGLPVASGWQKYDLTTAIDGCFYYGNNIPSTKTLDSSDGTSATIYTLAQFQADPVFSTYVIGKITIEYGYYSTGYLSPAHICKVEVRHSGNIVDLELEPSLEEQFALLKDEETDAIKTTSTWTFGQPTLIAHNNGRADWQRGDAVLSTHQKGGTGWVARLFGGVQTGWDDAAAVYIPVNEMKLTDLSSALWTWFQTNAEMVGMSITLWVHDPTDNDKRAEISLDNVNAALTHHEAGWCAHEMSTTTDYFYYFGEHTGATLTAGAENKYGLDDFQEDPAFSSWTIYRISLEYGYHSESQVLEYAYLADVKINGVVVPLKPSVEEQLDIVRDDQAKALTTIPTWTFGEPTLRDSGDASAVWSRWQHQQTHTGWTVKLYGGDQSSWQDWAKVCIPVNELPINKLKSASWAWYNTEEEYSGVAMQIHIHDPDDNDHRVDLSQAGGDMADKGAGWCAHELAMVNRFAWYGEDGPSAGSDITEGALAFLSEFLKDPLFGRWTIYRIDLYWGAIGNSQTFEDVWISNIKINGQVIPLKPDSSGTGRIGYKFITASSGNITASCKPKTPFRLLNVMLHLDAAATANDFTLTCDVGRTASVYDILLYKKAMAGVQDVVVPFGEGYEFMVDDEIDAAWTNSGTVTYGITFAYQTVF